MEEIMLPGEEPISFFNPETMLKSLSKLLRCMWSLPSVQVHLLWCGAILNLWALSGQCGACLGWHTQTAPVRQLPLNLYLALSSLRLTHISLYTFLINKLHKHWKKCNHIQILNWQNIVLQDTYRLLSNWLKFIHKLYAAISSNELYFKTSGQRRNKRILLVLMATQYWILPSCPLKSPFIYVFCFFRDKL